jgi:hypothetical protein
VKHKKLNPTAAEQAVLSNTCAALDHRLGPITYRPLADVHAYDGHARKHPEKQIVQLMASMREFGFALPVLIDEADVVIVGHARIEAARRLGMTEVPVLVASHWSAAQVKAYRLADNQLARHATWDEDLLRVEIESIIELDEMPIEILGWETAEIDILMDGTATAAADPAEDVPDAPAIPVTRPGEIWDLGKHRLLCGSSLESENWNLLLGDREGAMVLTDAPFNVPVNGHVSGSNRHAEFAMASGEMSQDQFVAFNETYLNNMKAHLKDGAIVMAFMDHHHLWELMTAARRAKLKHLNLCVWGKTNGGMGSLYRSQHELVLVLKHGSAPHTNTVQLGKHGRYRTNIWTHAGANSFSATRDADLADHPTVKPVGLLTEAIRDVTQTGEIVLDAFAGSGSTILACERTKRVGYAIEIEPVYVDVAIRRWQAMTGRDAVNSDGQSFNDAAIERAAGREPALAA